jgi:ADP-ribosyl-[dinitrogen reductase] hydrolase
MPVHWYYDRAALRRDHGHVTDLVAPKEPHPDSILWRSSYEPPTPEADILHDQARFWGRRGVHYHRGLSAGDNTLTADLARLVIESLLECGGHDPDDWLGRYVDFMTTPGRHRDTYVEECHRGFFLNRARGLALRRCAVEEKHVGGLVAAVPVIAWYRDDPERARRAAREQVALTHAGPRMEAAVDLLSDVLLATLRGEGLRAVLLDRVSRQTHRFLGHPFSKWQEQDDAVVVGRRVSTACYVEDAVPAIVHLALRYHAEPEAGLVANTNLGGDNVHRGAVLGALLGAECGPEAWPERWLAGLTRPVPELDAPLGPR